MGINYEKGKDFKFKTPNNSNNRPTGTNAIGENSIIGIIYKAQIIDGELKYNREEIADAKWLTYDEILNMKESLRSKEALIKCLDNYKNNKYILLDDIIKL